MFPSRHESLQHEDLEVLVHVTVHTTHHLHGGNVAGYMTGACCAASHTSNGKKALCSKLKLLPKKTQEAINSSAFISAKLDLVLFYLQNSGAFKSINLTSHEHTNDMGRYFVHGHSLIMHASGPKI